MFKLSIVAVVVSILTCLSSYAQEWSDWENIVVSDDQTGRRLAVLKWRKENQPDNLMEIEWRIINVSSHKFYNLKLGEYGYTCSNGNVINQEHQIDQNFVIDRGVELVFSDFLYVRDCPDVTSVRFLGEDTLTYDERP